MSSPEPPEGCTCASFWTVRQTHKSDCPKNLPANEDELDEILITLARIGVKYPKQINPEWPPIIEAKSQLLAWRNKYCLEVIGEDIPPVQGKNLC